MPLEYLFGASRVNKLGRLIGTQDVARFNRRYNIGVYHRLNQVNRDKTIHFYFIFLTLPLAPSYEIFKCIEIFFRSVLSTSLCQENT